jgi:MFS family permease
MKHNDKPYAITELLIPRVMTAAMNYASLSLVDISFRAVQPVFLSTPIHLGGLGLPPHTIGTILSCYGILNGMLSIFFFAKIHDRWGTKTVFMAGLASAIPVFATFPILSAMAKSQGLSTMVWAGVAVQVVFSIFLSMSYGELTTSKLRFGKFFILFCLTERVCLLCRVQVVCSSTSLLRLLTEHLSAVRMVSASAWSRSRVPLDQQSPTHSSRCPWRKAILADRLFMLF